MRLVREACGSYPRASVAGVTVLEPAPVRVIALCAGHLLTQTVFTPQVQELLGALSRVAQERDAALSNASTLSLSHTHSQRPRTASRRDSVASAGSGHDLPDQLAAVHDAVLSRVHFSRTEAGPASAEVEQLLADLAKERAAVAASAADVEDLEAALGHATVRAPGPPSQSPCGLVALPCPASPLCSHHRTCARQRFLVCKSKSRRRRRRQRRGASGMRSSARSWRHTTGARRGSVLRKQRPLTARLGWRTLWQTQPSLAAHMNAVVRLLHGPCRSAMRRSVSSTLLAAN